MKTSRTARPYDRYANIFMKAASTKYSAAARGSRTRSSVDDERVARDADDGRDGIEREDDVGRLQEHQHEQQRGGQAPPVEPRDELPADVAVAQRHEPPHQPHDRVLLRPNLLVFREGELDAGDDQERAEDEDHPLEALDELQAAEDEDRPENQGAENAPEQHAMVVHARDGEVREDHGEHEQVVEGSAHARSDTR